MLSPPAWQSQLGPAPASSRLGRKRGSFQIDAFRTLESQQRSGPTSPISTSVPSPAARSHTISSQLGFDEQLNQPELYMHDEPEEAQHLLPYATVQEHNFNLELFLHGPFSFVQSDWFLMLSGAVVTFNLVLLYNQFVDHSVEDLEALELLNQICLVFYCIEVSLRLLHFKKWFFYHRADRVWNFFDLLIACTGVADQWLVPRTRASGTMLSGFWMPALRAVRLFRVVRVLKLVGVLLRSDFGWTESTTFNSVVSAVIMLNIVIMGLETDIQSRIWGPIDDLMLLFFTFELSVKLRRHGWSFFSSEDCVWNCIDALIVVAGVIDQWVLNLWMTVVENQSRVDQLTDLFLLVRMLRLLRILRLLRLVKAVRPLYMLAQGMVQAMQGMFWVLVLTLVALYTSAILMTRVIGHGVALADPEDIPHVTRRLFETVPASMFTLFLLMNGEEWIKVEPLLSRYPSMKVAFIIFTVFSSWALLSVMTGVVSDNMIFAREEQNKKDDVVQGERRKRIEQALTEIYVAADAADGGGLSRDRYFELLDIPYHARKVQGVVPQLPLKDIRDVFGWLDVDDTGEVEFQELVRGFLTCAEPITGKALLQVDSDAKHRFRELHQQVEQLNTSVADLKSAAKEHHQCFMEALDDFREVTTVDLSRNSQG